MNNSFKKILHNLLGTLSLETKQGYPSVNLALQVILSKKTFKRIVLSTPDRRQIMQEAAALKSISEDEMIKLVAEKLELPVFFKPKAINLDLLPVSVSVKDLRRFGVLPLFSQNLICGVVCVDPAELANIPGLYTGSNIYLSSWSSVLGAIEESEQNYLESKLEEINKTDLQEQQLIAKLLNRLLTELDQREADTLIFEDKQDLVKYYFKDESNQEWQGEVSYPIGARLLAYLQHRIASRKTDLSFFGFGNLQVDAIAGQLLIRRVRVSNVINFPGVKEIQTEISRQSFTETKLNLLLIDDNPGYLQIMQKYLERQGYNTKCISSIRAAREYLSSSINSLPALIISDLHLKDGLALTLLEEMKLTKSLTDIPVIILTADQRQESEIKVLAHGADAFLAKNKDPKILALQIKRLLKYRAAA